jgi:hypothetical protein
MTARGLKLSKIRPLLLKGPKDPRCVTPLKVRAVVALCIHADRNWLFGHNKLMTSDPSNTDDPSVKGLSRSPGLFLGSITLIIRVLACAVPLTGLVVLHDDREGEVLRAVGFDAVHLRLDRKNVLAAVLYLQSEHMDSISHVPRLGHLRGSQERRMKSG